MSVEVVDIYYSPVFTSTSVNSIDLFSVVLVLIEKINQKLENFITFPNTSKFVKNTLVSAAHAILNLPGNVMKHSLMFDVIVLIT